LTTFTDMFYRRLFELDATIEKIFDKASAPVFGRAAIGIVSSVVKSIDNYESIVDNLQGIGRKHSIWGVKESHYDSVFPAMMYTFQELLGSKITPQLLEAWGLVFDYLVQVLITAQRKGEAPFSGKLETKKKFLMFSYWSPQWFILDLQNLNCFGQPGKLKLVIPLSTIITADPAEDFEHDRKGPCLKVVTQDKTIFIGTKSEQELKEWVFEFEWRRAAVKRQELKRLMKLRQENQVS